jgi:hypothetical protein
MNKKFGVVMLLMVALLVSSCAPSPENLIVGRWESETAVKLRAEFRSDGTALLNMMGRTMQGMYKVNGGNELEWSMNGITTKSKLTVTSTELALTDDQNRTIKYRRM